jgi:hypothetical protein
VVVEGIHAAEEELGAASSEDVGATIPTNVLDRVEVVGDFGNSRRDDDTVLKFTVRFWVCTRNRGRLTRDTRNMAIYSASMITITLLRGGYSCSSCICSGPVTCGSPFSL